MSYKFIVLLFLSSCCFANSFPPVIDLNNLNGNNGFVINGVNSEDRSGNSVSQAGDINGDGLDDIIIGAHWADPSGIDKAGSSYVIYGKSTSFSSSLDLATLDGNNGFVINGINEDDLSGYSVSQAGDINGDGLDDIIIGAFATDIDTNSDAGSSYVVFGNSSGFSSSFDLATLDGNNGFVINGINENDNSGRSVSQAGDINGDGFDDLIIGAIWPGNVGISYVVYGNNTGFSSSLDLATLDGNIGFVINGVNEVDYTGWSVSQAGDINGDGLDDIIIGAPLADPGGNDRAGSSYVVFGNSSGFSSSFDLATLDGNNGFVINGVGVKDYSGFSVSQSGDVNGDGLHDLIIGAYGSSPINGFRPGSSYVVFGKNTGFSNTLELADLDGNNGFVINGIINEENFGASVSQAGDVNGDGIDDIIIGAYLGFNGGRGYVVFGKNTGFSNSLDLTTLDGSNGFIINGIKTNDRTGNSVSQAGDLNGDGLDDIIIGAHWAGSKAGSSYVVFGNDIIFSNNFDNSD